MAVKFKFHQKLYLSESMEEKNLGKIKRKLRTRLLFADVYLIVPAGNPLDQLDILDARQLVQSHYKGKTFLVVGLASDYTEALQVIERMVQDCLRERGDCKLREYLVC